MFFMFSTHFFNVFDVHQTYSMFSHLRWQDYRICGALIMRISVKEEKMELVEMLKVEMA